MPYKISYFHYFLDDDNNLRYKSKYFNVGTLQKMYNQCCQILQYTNELINHAKQNYPDKFAFMQSGTHFINEVDEMIVFPQWYKYERKVKNRDRHKITILDNTVLFDVYSNENFILSSSLTYSDPFPDDWASVYESAIYYVTRYRNEFGHIETSHSVLLTQVPSNEELLLPFNHILYSLFDIRIDMPYLLSKLNDCRTDTREIIPIGGMIKHKHTMFYCDIYNSNLGYFNWLIRHDKLDIRNSWQNT